MVESKECRKRFDKITDRKENQGYTDWKKWVHRQVEGYTDEKLQNLVKRTEIKLKITEEDMGLKVPSLLKESIPFVTILLTSLVTIMIAMMNSIITIYNASIDVSQVIEYAELASNVSSDFFGKLLGGCIICSIMYLILFFIEECIDRKDSLKKAKTRIYYRELLEILKEELVIKTS